MWRIALLLVVALWAELGQSSTAIYCTETPRIQLAQADVDTLEVSTTSMDSVYIHKILLDDISGIDAQCKKQGASILNPFQLNDILDCYPYYAFGDDYFEVTWTFRNFPDQSGDIVRFNETCFNRTCRYDTNYLLNTTGGFTVELQKLAFTEQSAEGAFGMAIGFYDWMFMTKQTMVVMPGLVYVMVKLTAPPAGDRIYVQLVNCWINDEEDSGAMPQYFIIMNKNVVAALSGEPADAKTEIRNFMPNNARFSFRSFFFSHNNINQSQYLFAHCEVDLCDQTIEGSCTSRGRRRRRDLAIGSEGSITPPKGQIVSYGPFRVASEMDNPCLENNGGCSEICSVIGNDAVCACTNRKALSRDGKTCTDFGLSEDGNMQVTRQDSTIIAAASLIAFALLIASCLFFFSRRLSSGHRVEVKDSLKY